MIFEGDTVIIHVEFNGFSGGKIDPDNLKIRIKEYDKTLVEEFDITSRERISAGVYEFMYVVPVGKPQLVYEFVGKINDYPIVVRGYIDRVWVKNIHDCNQLVF
jgi:hypothetical protein